MFVDSGNVGWAALVRNDLGQFVRGISGFKANNLNPYMVELIPAQEDLSWLKSWHVGDIILKINN
ncbi:hypothetical protein Gogos_019198 [Gossypium gossypioides]|uniref:Uncharacterized protein n=1 Tax=Gossypium gossypioides TaxID=34282 RepID=A0A7J9BGR1_GOSGO|nr:hypothetical protein [Gossypium gossypioides]